MSVTNIVLLPSTEGKDSVTGSPIRASGSFRTSGDYEATIETHNMSEGRLYIEASMESQATNWFAIPFEVGVSYLEFPHQGGGQDDQTITLAFKGNFTWVRARLDRSYVDVLPDTLGYLSIDLEIDGYTSTAPGSTPGGGSNPSNPSSNGVQTVSAENVGTGFGLYASSAGTTRDPNLLFRTLLSGNGITIAQTATSIRISRSVEDTAPTTLVGLTDTVDAITNNAVAIGRNDELAFTGTAGDNTALVFRSGNFVWVPVNDVGAGAVVFAVRQNGTTVLANTNGLNFTGSAVTVTDVGGVATVNIKSSPDFVETVEFLYTPGSAGNLSASDFLIAKTAGVTVDIVDPVNCIVAFSFTGRPYPPTAVALMGQVRQTNEFNYSNLSPGLGTRKIAGGGTASAPTLMGAFAGPITLQLRMLDTGASAPAGQRARTIVMFRF